MAKTAAAGTRPQRFRSVPTPSQRSGSARSAWLSTSLDSSPNEIPKGTMESILAAFPRLQMKRRMTECLSGIARARPQTTYDNFLRDFGERFVAGYKSPMSTMDLLSNAPFSE